MRKILGYSFVLGAILLASCSKKDEAKEVKKEAKENLPPEYKFQRNGKNTVDYREQKMILDMHSAIEAYGQEALWAEVSKKNFQEKATNTNSPFDYTNRSWFFESERLNQSPSIKIWNKIASSGKSKAKQKEIHNLFDTFFLELENLSKQRTDKASKGVGGYLFYNVKYHKRLLAANGVEPLQDMTKCLMGALELDQIVNECLSSQRLNVDNSKILEGKNCTAMEHVWDMAFGYTGLPQDPKLNYSGSSTTDSKKYRRFWSDYILKVDQVPVGRGIKKEIYDAFLRGRLAIVKKDYAKRDEQAKKIKEMMGKVCAVRAAHYLKKGAITLTDEGNSFNKAIAFHGISEGLGFVYSLRFTLKGANYDKELQNIKDGNGLWEKDVEDELMKLAQKIAKDFNFVLSEI